MVFRRLLLLVLVFGLFHLATLLAQRLLLPLTGSSESSSCGKMVKYFQRDFRLHDNGSTYLDIGLRYDRANTLMPQANLVLEKQALAGVPIVAGFYLTDEWAVEAGGFIGLNMCSPQETFWFNETADSGRDIAETRGLLLGMGFDVWEECRLKIQYMRLHDLPEHTVLRRFNVGWTWTW